MVDSPTSLALQAWLNDGRSFMRRLKEYRLQPRVMVLKEQWTAPEPQEQRSLRIPPRRHVFIREVEIQESGQPWMFARTVIPAATLTGRERILARMERRSLGSILFSYPALARSPFKVQACQLPRYSASALWERQSFFILKGKILLLREVFLPPLVRFIESL